MLEIKKADHKFYRCSACENEKVMQIRIQQDGSTSASSFHLCNTCLMSLSNKLDDYFKGNCNGKERQQRTDVLGK